MVWFLGAWVVTVVLCLMFSVAQEVVSAVDVVFHN